MLERFILEYKIDRYLVQYHIHTMQFYLDYYHTYNLKAPKLVAEAYYQKCLEANMMIQNAPNDGYLHSQFDEFWLYYQFYTFLYLTDFA